MKFYPISLVSPQKLSQDVHTQDLPSMLFERTANMEALQKEFSKVLLMSKKKRDRWMQENEEFIQDMLNKIRQESSIMVREFAFSELAKKSVTEYMVTVQQTLATLEKVAYDEEDSLSN